MRLPSIIFGLVATAAACGDGSLGSGGTAGTSATGTGGVAGTTGTGGFVVGDAGAGGAIAGSGGGGSGGGGSGGAIAGSTGAGTGGAGSLPACGGASGSTDTVQLAIVGPDSMAVTSTVSASVRVTAADSCSTVTCPSMISSSGLSFPVSVSTMATRFVLTATDARTWTLYLRNSAMPADLVKVDDTFDLTIQAGINQTFYSTLNQLIVLAHGTDLVLFASALDGFGVPPLPQLGAFGITLTDAGARCEIPPSFGCIIRPHAVHVTIGTTSADVAAGTTAIGWLSFSSASYLERKDTGNCDTKGNTVMAGFRTP